MAQKTVSERVDDRNADPSADPEIGIEQVRLAVKTIRFGEVRVVIQDGVIVQIDRIEKQRLR
jgi:hypothetical protein